MIAGDVVIDDEYVPCPTHQEIAEALLQAKRSWRGILRLGALMANVSLHHAPRLTDDGDDFRGHTHGVRAYLMSNAFLASCYHTLMRYARLGKLLAEYCGADGCQNLIWGLEEGCPSEFDDFRLDCANEFRVKFSEFEGMTFQGIYDRLAVEVMERRRQALRQETESKAKWENEMLRIRKVFRFDR